jgi:hypothetical protein
MPDNIEELQQQRRDRVITGEQYEREFFIGCIVEVLSDAEFKLRYC